MDPCWALTRTSSWTSSCTYTKNIHYMDLYVHNGNTNVPFNRWFIQMICIKTTKAKVCHVIYHDLTNHHPYIWYLRMKQAEAVWGVFASIFTVSFRIQVVCPSNPVSNEETWAVAAAAAQTVHHKTGLSLPLWIGLMVKEKKMEDSFALYDLMFRARLQNVCVCEPDWLWCPPGMGNRDVC